MRTACILLAAGLASRMGRPKQVLLYRGRPLIQHVLDTAAAIPDFTEIVVVLGHEAETVEARLHFPALARVVVNAAYETGQASSLRAGLDALAPETDAALVLLADQPEVRHETVAAALERHASTGRPVVRTRYRGQPGHPVVLGREVWDEVVSRDADEGARSALEDHPEWIEVLDLDEPPPRSVDTPEDYLELLSDSGGPTKGR